MRVLVCGGRDYTDRVTVYRVLNELAKDAHNLIHGGARGADTLAGDWADSKSIPVSVFLPDWKEYGKAAGVLRNKQMLDVGKPDLVIAFPGGAGTLNMLQQATKAGVPVRIIND